MFPKLIPEQQYLKELALREFNFQFGTKFKHTDCIIYSVKPPTGFRLGYEIDTCRCEDRRRIRIYLNLSNTDSMGYFRLTVAPEFKKGAGDEVWVSQGSIDTTHTSYRGYLFLWIKDKLNDPDARPYPILLKANRNKIRLANGGCVKLVNLGARI